MRGKVLFRPKAIQDIVDQAGYIAEHDLDAALRFLGAVEHTLNNLAEMPKLGVERRFEHPDLANIRMKLVQGFSMHLLFYREVYGGIELIRLLHSRRDIQTALDEDGP